MYRATSSLAAVLLAILVVPSSSVSQESPEKEDARSLMKRLLDSAPDVPFTSRMKVTTPGNLEREFTSHIKPLDDEVDGRYIEVTSPFSLIDNRYLFYERTEGVDEQYTYMPSMKRVIRLAEKNRREPFLGSTFYITDLVAPPLDDFTYEFLAEEEVGGRHCRIVESVPKNPEKELYSKTIFAIDPKDLVIMRSQSFDERGKPFKVLTTEKLEKIDDWWTPLRQRMDNLSDETSSTLEVLEIQYRVPLTDDLFRIAYLGR
jgi:outer membrane lipoprotein-sorting protein